MRELPGAALITTLLLAAGGAQAQKPPARAETWPTKPVRFLVGYPAGGAVDITTRVIGQRLADRLGQPVVVDNRPGNTGNIAGDLLAKSPADGYTIYMATGINAVSVSLFKHLPYSPERDFAPVSRAIYTTSVLVINPGVPAKNLAEFVAHARANPGKLNYATTGSGGSPHLSAELLSSMAGIRMVHVPYKGGPQSMQELIAGGVQLSFANIPNAMPFVKQGRLRALGVTSAKRSALVPELPTIAEQGFPGYDLDVWYGVVAPAGTPGAIVERLNREIVAILKLQEVRDIYAVQGMESAPSTAQELTAEIKRDIAKYAKIVKAANITAD